jgi:hypothetical protein
MAKRGRFRGSHAGAPGSGGCSAIAGELAARPRLRLKPLSHDARRAAGRGCRVVNGRRLSWFVADGLTRETRADERISNIPFIIRGRARSAAMQFRLHISLSRTFFQTPPSDHKALTYCFFEKNPCGYRMGQVNSHGESRPSESDPGAAATDRGQQPLAKNGATPGLQRADRRAERVSPKGDLAEGEDLSSNPLL